MKKNFIYMLIFLCKNEILLLNMSKLLKIPDFFQAFSKISRIPGKVSTLLDIFQRIFWYYSNLEEIKFIQVHLTYKIYYCCTTSNVSSILPIWDGLKFFFFDQLILRNGVNYCFKMLNKCYLVNIYFLKKETIKVPLF